MIDFDNFNDNTSYLEIFTTSIINRKSSPEKVVGLSGNRLAKMEKINPDFTNDIYFFMIIQNQKKNFLSKEEAFELAASLYKRASTGSNNIFPWVFTSAERKYLFSQPSIEAFQEIQYPANFLNKKITRLDPRTVKVEYGFWVFTLTKHNSSIVSIYNHTEDSLLFSPIFIRGTTKNTSSIIDLEDVTKAVLKHQTNSRKPGPKENYTQSLCPCLSGFLYIDCCIDIFHDVNQVDLAPIFGFTYIDLVKEIELQKMGFAENPHDLPILSIVNSIQDEQVSLENVVNEIVEKVYIPVFNFTDEEAAKEAQANRSPSDIANGVTYLPDASKNEKVLELKNLVMDSVKDRIDADEKIVWVVYDRRHLAVNTALDDEQLDVLIENYIYQQSLIFFLNDIERIMQPLLDNRLKELVSEIDSWTDLFNENTVTCIKKSLQLYSESRYEEACHLLIVQVEAALRQIAILLRIPITSYKTNKSHSKQYVPLGDLIDKVLGTDDPSFSDKSRFAKDALKTLYHQLLTRNGGFYNMRNEIAHRFENKVLGQFEYLMTFYLILLLPRGFQVKYL